jgi:hypothetical protein
MRNEKGFTPDNAHACAREGECWRDPNVITVFMFALMPYPDKGGVMGNSL